MYAYAGSEDTLTKPTIKVNWRVYSGSFEGGSNVSVFERGDHIYVLGWQAPNINRIEKRHKVDGTLVKAWTSEGRNLRAMYRSCAIADDRLYVFCGQYILAFDLNLNPIRSVPRDVGLDDVVPSTILCDGFLYVAGHRVKGNVFSTTHSWVVEKRRIADLTLVKRHARRINVWSLHHFSRPEDIALNPLTNQLWVVGKKDDVIMIEVLDLELKPLMIKTINKEVEAVMAGPAVDFDDEGCAYIGIIERHNGRLFKYDKYGDEVTSVKLPNFYPWELKYINGYLYVAGNRRHDKPPLRHVLRIFDKNLNQVDELFLSADTRTNYEQFFS
jgi:hypothetical protein